MEIPRPKTSLPAPAEAPPPAEPPKSEQPPKPETGEVVSLDKFRKK
jgi:hypothetical protein